MSPNAQRALLLIEQSRFEQAAEQLRIALAAEPDDGYLHSMLALCLEEGEEYAAANEEAKLGIQHDPGSPFAHYILARVLHSRNMYGPAQRAAEEAVQLDPEDADYLAMLSQIHLNKSEPKEALAAADRGLQFDPEHLACTNLRAMALVKLGRKEEAGRTVDQALARNPDNAFSHANRGWTLLHQGKSKESLEHFREALRLDPENDWARAGILEALKARNFIYAFMLRYFLWMSRLSQGAQWGVIIGGYLGFRFLSNYASTHPEAKPWILPVQIIYITFAVLTWTASPLFNLLLRLNRFGRLVLSRDEVVAANWVGACIGLALLSLLLSFTLYPPLLICALIFGLLLIPVSGTFSCSEGWPRRVMATFTIAMAAIGLTAATLITLESPGSGDNGGESLGFSLFTIFLIGAIASPWLGNFLVTRQPTK